MTCITGALFAGEFLFTYAGLGYTAASRMVVFLYLAPCLTALGLQWLVPGERLNAGQWTGVVLAFLGVALAFADGFGTAGGPTLLGVAFGVIFLSEPLSAAFIGAALLVGAGIVLVNRPAK